ncbi:MAG TPA: amidase [Amycolatopsis sp.]|nr:amidase [Amycolatopsis sp.]
MTTPATVSAREIAAQIRLGRRSAAALVDGYLDRIEATNGAISHDGGPDDINAWVRVYSERAQRHAREIDSRTVHPGGGWLAGVPLGIKDVISIDNAPATASSRRIPVRDTAPPAEVWRRLASAGAIPLGHTHTHEFAAGPTTDQCANPWDRTRSAGGSSGGSAAAVAAGMIPAALGTDTAGSIRLPAALCGITGFKPTLGSVPGTGVIPLGRSFDHVGPLALTAADCALIFDVCAGAADPGPIGKRDRTPRPLAGTVIALIGRPSPEGLHPDVADGLQRTADALRDLGATVTELDPPQPAPDVLTELTALLMTDIWRFHSSLRPHPAAYQADVAATVTQAATLAMPDDEYAAAQSRRSRVAAAWDAWFTGNRVDAILEPTCPIPAPVRGRRGDAHPERYRLLEFTSWWNYTGNPVVALPSGIGGTSRLPVSASLIGRRRGDRDVLQLAVDLQEVLPPTPLEL